MVGCVMGTGDEIVGRLFPPFVRGALMPAGDPKESPYAEERRAVAGASDSRRREFAAGRACAHAALHAIGCDTGPVGMGTRRQPLWPAGTVGSISHAGSLAGAVVARTDDARGLGFDVEVLDPPLGPDVAAMVAAPAELGEAADGNPLDPYRSKIAFSAKECVYKCLFPLWRRHLEFTDVTLDLDLPGGRFTARVAAAPLLDPGTMEGGMVVVPPYLFTGVCLPSAGAWGISAGAEGIQSQPEPGESKNRRTDAATASGSWRGPR